MINMNPLEILGRRFEDVSNQFENSGILEIHDNLEESEEQEYCVSAPDESWEIHLGKNNSITTIFLFLAKGYAGFDGVNNLTARDEILRKYGSPIKFSAEKEVAILGKMGAWERYDYPDYVLHFSHSIGSDRVEQITLMLPKVAP